MGCWVGATVLIVTLYQLLTFSPWSLLLKAGLSEWTLLPPLMSPSPVVYLYPESTDFWVKVAVSSPGL